MKYNKEDLIKLIFKDKMSYEEIGRLYGVTGNAIKKTAAKLGIKLPKKRSINPKEHFNRKRSKIDTFTDEEFSKIIKNNIGWKDILTSFGYSKNNHRGNYLIKNKIRERCLKLNIELCLTKPSPVLSKTKGELLQSRKNYQSYRSSVRTLAEQIYKNSGKECKCAICGYSNHIEIAHIKAVSEFDNSATIAEINSIDNLIALCPNHHWEYDNGLLQKDELKSSSVSITNQKEK